MIEEQRELWQQYLARKNHRPLQGFLWEPDVRPLAATVERVGHGNLLRPEDLWIEDLLSHVEEVLQATAGWISDFPQAISPCMGVPWMEAIIGCRIMVYEDTIWAEPPDGGYDWLNQLRITPDNKWLQRLLLLYERLVSYAEDRYPVCLPVMHGPLDIISAFRSPIQFCYDIYDQPLRIKEAACILTDIWSEIARLLMINTPSFMGGWFTRMNLYMEGRAATPQADVTSLLSSQAYQEFCLRGDQKLMQSLPGQTYHTHSTSAHVLPTICRIPNLRSLQVTIDPNGPSKGELKTILQECQQKVPLLLAVWNGDDFLWALREFEPQGLAVVLIKTEMSGKEEYELLLRKASLREEGY
jgi:hypothetical protein